MYINDCKIITFGLCVGWYVVVVEEYRIMKEKTKNSILKVCEHETDNHHVIETVAVLDELYYEAVTNTQ